MEAEPACPDEVRNLIYDTEETFRNLGPAEVPDMIADAALREIAAGECGASASARWSVLRSLEDARGMGARRSASVSLRLRFVFLH